MSGHGGKRAGAGRPKGRVSQETADIKAMVIGALHQAGGVDYLTARALDTPSAFLALVGKVLPLQLAGHDGQRLQVDFRWADPEPPQTIEAPATVVIDAEPADDAPDVQFIGECD